MQLCTYSTSNSNQNGLKCYIKTIKHLILWKGNLPPLVSVVYFALPSELLMPPWLHDPYTWHCNSQFVYQQLLRHPGRNKLVLKKPLNSYSLASGNFGEELSVPGLSWRYEADIPCTVFSISKIKFTLDHYKKVYIINSIASVWFWPCFIQMGISESTFLWAREQR